VGFWQPCETKHAPSVTKTFFTSQDWFHLFKTDVFGSAPIRAVPTSWMQKPGGAGVELVYKVLKPAESTISLIVSRASLAMARSLSPCAHSMRRAGMPHASVFSGSIVTRFSLRGSISHHAPSQNGISFGFSRTNFLNSEPKPGACLAGANEYPCEQLPCIP